MDIVRDLISSINFIPLELRQFASVIIGIFAVIITLVNSSIKEQIFQIEMAREMAADIFWTNLSPRGFEIQLANFFSLRGYKTTITQSSKDGGVDIVLNKDGQISYVQCKMYSKNVGVKAVRELYGVMQSNNVQNGIVANGFGGFSKDAYNFANKTGIQLLSRSQIVNMSKDSLSQLKK